LKRRRKEEKNGSGGDGAAAILLSRRHLFDFSSSYDYFPPYTTPITFTCFVV
jgi:hypothetical protein